jgi:hypothetical protein
MKTLKLVLIAAFFATALVSQANTDESRSKAANHSVSISFDRAMQNQALVVTMYAQLDPGFLSHYEQLYVVNVYHMGMHFKILGSRQDFISFFSKKWKYVIASKSADYNTE